MLGVKDKQAILDRYNELAMNYSDETADEMTRLQDEIEAKGLWDLDSQVEQAMDALGCPPDDARGGDAFGRRAPPRRALPPPAREARPPAARRADQPSRRRDRQLARGAFARLSGRDPHRHPRSLLPRQRHGLDSRARSRPRHSLRGQLFGLAQAEAEAARAGRPRGGRPPARARRGKRVDRLLAESPPGQVEGAHRRLRRTRQEEQREGADDRADHHSRRRAAGTERHRLRRSLEGLRRPAAHRQAFVQAAARRHRRRHRPQRRRQDHALPHDHRPGEAGLRARSRSASRSSSAMSTSRATRSTRRRTSGRRSPAATTSSLSPSAR